MMKIKQQKNHDVHKAAQSDAGGGVQWHTLYRRRRKASDPDVLPESEFVGSWKAGFGNWPRHELAFKSFLKRGIYKSLG